MISYYAIVQLTIISTHAHKNKWCEKGNLDQLLSKNRHSLSDCYAIALNIAYSNLKKHLDIC